MSNKSKSKADRYQLYNCMLSCALVVIMLLIIFTKSSTSSFFLFKMPINGLGLILGALPKHIIIGMFIGNLVRLLFTGLMFLGLFLYIYVLAKTISFRIHSLYLNMFIASGLALFIGGILPDVAHPNMFNSPVYEYFYYRYFIFVFTLLLFSAIKSMILYSKTESPIILKSMSKSAVVSAASLYIFLCFTTVL